jgi:hypothetical protein
MNQDYISVQHNIFYLLIIQILLSTLKMHYGNPNALIIQILLSTLKMHYGNPNALIIQVLLSTLKMHYGISNVVFDWYIIMIHVSVTTSGWQALGLNVIFVHKIWSMCVLVSLVSCCVRCVCKIICGGDGRAYLCVVI